MSRGWNRKTSQKRFRQWLLAVTVTNIASSSSGSSSMPSSEQFDRRNRNPNVRASAYDKTLDRDMKRKCLAEGKIHSSKDPWPSDPNASIQQSNLRFNSSTSSIFNYIGRHYLWSELDGDLIDCHLWVFQLFVNSTSVSKTCLSLESLSWISRTCSKTCLQSLQDSSNLDWSFIGKYW